MGKLIYMKEVLDTLSEEVFKELVSKGTIKMNKEDVLYLEINEDETVQE
jgi:hypothetical protein